MGPTLCRSAEGGRAATARWEDFSTQGLKIIRGPAKWQLSILTVGDRNGARFFQRLANRTDASLSIVLKPLVPGDAELCFFIENLVARLKDGHRIAAYCDRRAKVFLSACGLTAAVMFWL